MQQINSYIYDNLVVVQLDTDPDIIQRNRVVYTRTLQIYKNSSNVIKVKVQNQDQKPVNVTGHDFYFQIIDDYASANATPVYRGLVTFSNATVGTGYVVINGCDLTQLDRDQYTYSVYTPTCWGNVATYVDDNYGAQGQIFVNDDAYPQGDPAPLDLGRVGDGITSAMYDFGTV